MATVAWALEDGRQHDHPAQACGASKSPETLRIWRYIIHRVLLATTCIGLVYGPLSSGEGQTGGAIERPAVAAGTEGVNPATTVYIDPETGELLEQPPTGAVPLVTPSVPLAELEQVESPVPRWGCHGRCERTIPNAA